MSRGQEIAANLSDIVLTKSGSARSIGSALKLGARVEISRESAEWLFDFSLRPGSAVSLKDQNGKWFRARVLSRGSSQITALAFEEMSNSPESGLFLVLLQAVPNKERMELVIEKSVELGADLIQPFFSERSCRLEDLPQPKWRNWQERARKASEQCRRGVVPKVLKPGKLAEALDVSKAAELKLVLYEKQKAPGMKAALETRRGVRSCALAVGPEGGFSEREIDEFCSQGFIPVSMGGRILRTETSSITAAGIIQFYLGDLGGG